MRALVLTTMLVLAGCSPQRSYPLKSADEINQLIAIANAAFDVAEKAFSGAPAEEIQEATRKVGVAIDAAQKQTDEILRHATNIDHLARGKIDPMGVGSCITWHQEELHDIEKMLPTTGLYWATEVGSCAASTITSFEAVPLADSGVLALSLHIIDPILLVAKARSNLRRGGVMHYLESNKDIITKFAPECEKVAQTNDVNYRCAAYQVAIAVRPRLQALEQQVELTP